MITVIIIVVIADRAATSCVAVMAPLFLMLRILALPELQTYTAAAVGLTQHQSSVPTRLCTSIHTRTQQQQQKLIL